METFAIEQKSQRRSKEIRAEDGEANDSFICYHFVQFIASGVDAAATTTTADWPEKDSK